MNTQVKDTISNIVSSISAKELSNALKSCLTILESKSSFKRELINELNRALIGREESHKFYSFFHKSSGNLDNVYVHDFKDASVIYASHMLIKINKINDYKLRLQSLINFFDNELTKPITTGLTKADILSAFKSMQLKFRVFEIITCKNGLEVFLFNNSHINYNSLCEVFYDPSKPGTYYSRYILSFAPFSEENNPYQVLAHEVGHALQLALTHDMNVVPESFIELNKFLDVQLKNNTKEASEVFADIFSIAVMRGTPFEKHNLFFQHFPVKAVNLFERYFIELTKFAYGNRLNLKDGPMDLVLSSNM